LAPLDLSRGDLWRSLPLDRRGGPLELPRGDGLTHFALRGRRGVPTSAQLAGPAAGAVNGVLRSAARRLDRPLPRARLVKSLSRPRCVLCLPCAGGIPGPLCVL
jgi:hypothetical protein